MDAQITRLLDVLGRLPRSAPADVPAFLQALPDVGTLPTPWETWTLIGLIRHRDRQYWVREIIQNRLRGDSARIGEMGAFGHPDGVPQGGSVPGMPEWEYYFHGRGCCLTHKVTGEDIDVDFWDDGAEYFDVFFYTNYLKSLRNPEPPERRLLELHRSLRPVPIAVANLRAAGAMTTMPDRDDRPMRIADPVLARCDAFDEFCRAWAVPANRTCLAGLIGDWPAAHEIADGQENIQRITAPRAEECRAIRRQQLLEESGHAASDALYGLVELGGADERIVAALRGPPTGILSSALEIAGQQNAPKYCPHIYAALRRVRPNGPVPEPHIWITSLKFLLRHGYQKDELLASLAKTGGTEIGEDVLLAFENAPENVLPLVRMALLDDIPCNRTSVAAILALIGKPWSIRELLKALNASDDQTKTAGVRAALLETGDADSERAVLAWEAANPHEDEPGNYVEIDGRMVGPFYSMADLRLKDTPSFLRYEMDKLHDRVMQIKDVIPPEPTPTKPWWKFWGR